jgi:hypothetical protein
MLFHMTYNGLMFATQLWPGTLEQHPSLTPFVHEPAPGQILYSWPVMLVCAVVASVLLKWLHRLPYQATREEQITDARARQSHQPFAVAAPGAVESRLS